MAGSDRFIVGPDGVPYGPFDVADPGGRAVEALRSVTSPAPDHHEQLVALRTAIATTRHQARQFREAGFLDVGHHYDRRADVLEHVLRRLAAEGSNG